MPPRPDFTIPAKHEAIAKFVREQKGKPKKAWSIAGEDDLKLVTHPSGAASWTFIKRVPGRASPLRLKLGDHGVMTFAEARLKTKEHQITVGQGIDPKQAIKASESFQCVAERALVEHPTWSKLTRKRYAANLKADVFPAFGSKPINTVTTDDCIAVCQKVKPRGLTHADNMRDTMMGVFKWAIGESIVKAPNPVHGVPKAVEKKKPRERLPTAREIYLIWRAVDESKRMSAAMKIAIKFTILSDLRRGEVCGLMCNERQGDTVVIAADVEKGGRINVEGRMKNGREQRVYLSRQAAALLDEANKVCSDGTYFFPADPDRVKGALKTPHLNPDSVTGRIADLRKALKIDDLVIHDMRTAITTWADDMGVDERTQKALLHHTPQDVTSKHYRLSKGEARMRKALQMWADHVERIVNAPDADAAQKIDDDARKAAADAILSA